jgi:hypothetical protein
MQHSKAVSARAYRSVGNWLQAPATPRPTR